MPNKTMVKVLVEKCKAGIEVDSEKLIIMTAINLLDIPDQKDFLNEMIFQQFFPPQVPEWFTIQQIKLFF